jgi:hypothetical protein
MSGLTGGKSRELADYMINVPAEDTRLIQESHSILYHTLCQMLEDDLIEAGLCNYITSPVRVNK